LAAVARQRRPLPPPAPPETRTIGQLVAETVRLYGDRFWPSITLGLSVAALDAIVVPLPRLYQFAAAAGAGEILMTAAYIGASVIVSGTRPTQRAVINGFLVGILVWPAAALLPLAFAFFGNIYIALLGFLVPSLAWLAYVGLSVPAAVIERIGVRRAIGRGMELASVDFFHAFGSLGTLVFVYFLTRETLYFLLRGAAKNEAYTAAFLADVVISPMLFLGAALLYVDQAARLDKVRRRAIERSPDADLHPVEHADGAGSSDAEVEPRSAARGES
jgi:hypothetical protein